MKKKAAPVLAIVLLIVIVAGIGFLTRVIKKYTPSSEVMSSQEYFGLDHEGEAAIVAGSEILPYKGKILNEVAYVDYQAVKEVLNDYFYWDSENNTMLYTMPTDVVQIPAGSNSYTADGKTQSLNYNIVLIDGTETYIALDFVKQYTDISYETFHDPDRIVINNEWGDMTVASIRKAGKVRNLGGIKSPILREVEKNEVVRILEPMEDWTKILTQDGYIGYIKNDRLVKERTETRISDFVAPEYTNIQKDYKINLVWHQTTSMDANYNIIYDIANVKKVNTISPTWFSIASNDGTLDSLALADYVDTAHSNHMEVWPLVDNFSENIDFTAVMNSTSARNKIENQLIAAAIEYSFDGINVDFENISEDAADGYIQFMRELSVMCRKNGIVLSVDVPVPMDFTAHYNRKALGEVCDYLMIMGYDEHYAGSEEAGTVASLSFEEEGIQNTLQEVAAEKVVSGIPFYTRLWCTTTNEDGTTTVTSEAMGMNQAQQTLENNQVEASWDETTGQNYAQFNGESGELYQIWLEDTESLTRKLELIKNYDLGGVAEWKLGLEDDSVWDLIAKYIS
ncbi:Putative sporulation-specific glycosylase ydhD [uncultured Clostridium sp.]|uniref:Glycosyl hydrolase family 18 protein n=1 Tax=Muricoprocola aceti TaxID=2981772 RepID=A0ABT2SKP5_9FIRM|nr:glycosyl hydrolase family 18 protein [Muricoprocola aceti]MCU6725077.1 glycosyl hydrolase family 18 protein [Muricoprocola aceti]SCH37401.1 Putative sporulation-specific glycosylase ydhD [uncultured Clostridium sp.]